jgi:hypothetical protein
MANVSTVKFNGSSVDTLKLNSAVIWNIPSVSNPYKYTKGTKVKVGSSVLHKSGKLWKYSNGNNYNPCPSGWSVDYSGLKCSTTVTSAGHTSSWRACNGSTVYAKIINGDIYLKYTGTEYEKYISGWSPNQSSKTYGRCWRNEGEFIRVDSATLSGNTVSLRVRGYDPYSGWRFSWNVSLTPPVTTTETKNFNQI